jgi:hypothetical protein
VVPNRAKYRHDALMVLVLATNKVKRRYKN